MPIVKHGCFQIDKSVLKCWGLGGCQDQRLLSVDCINDDDEVRK